MSHREWIIERESRADKIADEWDEHFKSGQEPEEDPWKIIKEETGVSRPDHSNLSCANTNAHIIPTLSLIPFYDTTYFFYSSINWRKPERPSITSSAEFKDAYGLVPDDIIKLAEGHEIIPVHDSSVYATSDYVIDQLIYKMENRGIPHLTFPYLRILLDSFQFKTKIFPTSARDEYYTILEHLVSAGAV